MWLKSPASCRRCESPWATPRTCCPSRRNTARRLQSTPVIMALASSRKPGSLQPESLATESPAAGAARADSPLAEIDELVTGGPAQMLLVNGGAGELEALARHLQRRAAAAGRRWVTADGRIHDEPWREAAELLGVDPVADAVQVARALGPAAASALLIVHEAQPTTWGATVADELARLFAALQCQATVVVLTSRRSNITRRFELPARFEPRDVACFWDGLVAASRSQVQQFDGLAALERWWRGGGAANERARAALLSQPARRLHARMALLRRGCPEALVAELGTPAARDELLTGRWIRIAAGRSTVVEPPARLDTREAERVAQAICGVM